MSYADFFSIEVTQMRSNKKKDRRRCGIFAYRRRHHLHLRGCSGVVARQQERYAQGRSRYKGYHQQHVPGSAEHRAGYQAIYRTGRYDRTKGVNAEQGKIKLSWNKAFNASQYIVYRAGETSGGMGDLKAYKTVSGTSFTDTVDAASCYKYKVEPVRNSLGETQRGKSAEYSVMSRPEAVTGLGMPDKS